MISSSLTVVDSADSYDLTVLETVRAELGITDHSEDVNLTRWIRQASGAISAYCGGRVFAKETVSETFRAESCVNALILSRTPIASVTSVDENGSTLDATEYEVISGTGLLRRLSNDALAYWSHGKITVVYSGGYTLLTDLPYEIERAAIVLVTQYRASAQRDPQLRSESSDGLGSSSYFDGAYNGGMAPEVRGLLSGYCKHAW